jgi:hypothetical protein
VADSGNQRLEKFLQSMPAVATIVPSPTPASVLVVNLTANPTVFDPANVSTSINYVMNYDAAVSLVIQNASGNPVYQQSYQAGSFGGKQGLNQIVWNASSNGEPLSDGTYTVFLVANYASQQVTTQLSLILQTGMPTATFTPVSTVLPPTVTDTPASNPATSTATPAVSETSTPTSIAPTATYTIVPPTPTNTAWSIPPTNTNTPGSEPGTPTIVAPTSTYTNVPLTPTNTAVPPTPTYTNVPPTATYTSLPPTPTNTPVPPTATYTSVPPTPTFTQVPPTPTPTVPKKALLIEGYEISPSYISRVYGPPNVLIGFNLTEPASCNLVLKSPAGAVIYSNSFSGVLYYNAAYWVYPGYSNTSQRLPTGNYTFILTATDSGGAIATAQGVLTIGP